MFSLSTGGSRDIGAAIVKRLADEGAHVAFPYAGSPDQANETAKAAQALGVRAIATQSDKRRCDRGRRVGRAHWEALTS